MGKHSKKNHNPNWRKEQAAMASRARICHVHDNDARGEPGKRLKFSDRVLEVQTNGSLKRVA